MNSNENIIKKKVHRRSLLNRYFTDEIKMELLKITFLTEFNNNEKSELARKVLNKYNIPYNSLGNGTNRLGVQIDGYAVKIALDADGMIDNRRETLYSSKLQPYVIKVYEAYQNGLIMVCEYVRPFGMDDLSMYKGRVQSILKEISETFFIGDVGLTPKNYANWGFRLSNNEVVCLDFAYIYSVSYNLFRCPKCKDRLLKYDNNFVKLSCPICGREYEFGDIRRRISSAKQEEEIGNILRLSYVIKGGKTEEVFDEVPEFEFGYVKKKKNKKSDKKLEEKRILKEAKEAKKRYREMWDL